MRGSCEQKNGKGKRRDSTLNVAHPWDDGGGLAWHMSLQKKQADRVTVDLPAILTTSAINFTSKVTFAFLRNFVNKNEHPSSAQTSTRESQLGRVAFRTFKDRDWHLEQLREEP
jgi:hypothetical protein